MNQSLNPRGGKKQMVHDAWVPELERHRREAGVAWGELVGAEPEKLIAMANRRGVDLNLTLSPNDHRNVIDMLRRYYDDRVTRSKSDQRRYGEVEVLDAIASAFPWLGDQCAKEKAVRRWDQEDAQYRQRRARDVIEHLSVGDKVMVDWHGPREAEITEIRKTRVKATFTLPDGSRHVIDRSADQVSLK